MDGPQLNGPVAVGGLGGSGTRVVASMLTRLGVYIGGDLNEAGDNLWFTLLLRRPWWYEDRMKNDPGEIYRTLEVFEQSMLGRLKPTSEQLSLILHAAADQAAWLINPEWSTGGGWVLDRVVSLKEAGTMFPPFATWWGWKEPNTHIYLDFLHDHFADLRYIHVMRHGLDMALSPNQFQLGLWGSLFGVDRSRETSAAASSLTYWIEANSRALNLGRELLGDRFLLVNFDELCQHPREGVDRLLAFLGFDVPEDLIAGLATLPRVSPTTGRYRQADLGVFSIEQLAKVVELGFPVEHPTGARAP